MNQNGKRRTTSADKAVNVVIALIIIAFVVLGVLAIRDKISIAPKNEADDTTSTDTTQTVQQLADTAGMSVEDYLAQYGLTLSDELTAESSENDMINDMTIENYAKYGDMETEDLLQGLSENVTKDTVMKDLMNMPAVDVLGGEDAFNAAKEQYGLDDSVTGDMTWSEFQLTLMQAQYQAQLAAQSATADDTADTDAAEADTADTAQADTSAEQSAE